ncbi:hypothetical protein GGH92_005329 [Coemansia sp. RSA 2673]|nr:hypothetical protein GGH92_005329 [Coemansia sp. RSA 2673]
MDDGIKIKYTVLGAVDLPDQIAKLPNKHLIVSDLRQYIVTTYPQYKVVRITRSESEEVDANNGFSIHINTMYYVTLDTKHSFLAMTPIDEGMTF